MQPTKFSGPLLYSGQAKNSGFFADAPIGFNPDFIQKMDDFTRMAVDTTNDYNFYSASGGTVSILNANSETPLPSSDFGGGWAYIQSDPADTTAVNSGGSFQGIEFFNTLSGRTPLWLESRIGITNPKNCDFFYGATYAENINPPNTGSRIGFGISASDGTGELQIVVSNSTVSAIVINTGYIMPVMDTSASGIIDTRPQGSKSQRNSAPILSIKQVNMASHPNLIEPGHARIHFYIDRKHIGTIAQTESNPWPNTTTASSILYRKASELNETITLATALPNNTLSAFVKIDGVTGSNTGGSGLFTGQLLTIGTEVIEILRDYPSWSLTAGSTLSPPLEAPFYYVKRGVGSSTVSAHSVGAEFTSATSACMIDYTSQIHQRFASDSPFTPFTMNSPILKGSF